MLVVMMGLPGAGKTTFARELCRRERGWFHVDRDALRARMFPRGPLDDAARRAATDRAFALARRALHRRRSVLLDGMTFASLASRRRARALARAAGARCIELFLDVAPATAKARIAADGSHPAQDRDAALVDVVAARFAKVRPR